jgi:hypothetical protein
LVNEAVFAPAGLGENTAVVILAVVFTLLGGWLLLKMPDRKYEKGAFRHGLRKLRGAFPGLFSLSMTPLLEDEPENGPAPVEDKNAPEAEQLAFDAVLAEAAVAPEELPAETVPNLRDNNPLIAGIFVSGTVTLVMFGITLFSAFGYFGG